MFPYNGENKQFRQPDNEPNGSDLSDTEREERLFALAEQYTNEVNTATAVTSEAISQKWQEKLRELGIRRTNNLPQWFTPGGGLFGAYDIHGKAAEAYNPAVIYLRQLEQDEPELFKKCIEADQANKEVFDQWLKEMQSGGSAQQTVDHTLTRWNLDLIMTTAFNQMLTYPGASEDMINELCR